MSVPVSSILPPSLRAGSGVTIVSPSSTLLDASLVEGATRCLESWGLKVTVAPHALDKCGHFAASDADRLADMQQAVLDPSCQAILCSRGGYGALRFLSQLNLTSLSSHPKWLIGFSDVTALHAAFVNAGCCSLHAPMAKALSHYHSHKPVIRSYHNILFGTEGVHCMVNPSPLNRVGSARGRLVGGNLSLIYALQGTPFQFPAEGSVLFIEDLCEKLYQIDRMMQNLKLSGFLSHLSGLVVGQFADIPEDPDFGQSLEQIISDVCADYHFPIAFNFPIGHVDVNYPMVEGALYDFSVTNNCADLKQIIN